VWPDDPKPEQEPKEPVVPVKFDYDMLVIGGGSGGLACAKEAKEFGANVCLLDYVKPSPHGITWGIGGTCVNVGCIPKKLFHTSALYGSLIKDGVLDAYGWKIAPEEKGYEIKWEELVQNISDHIGSLNFGYKVQLRKAGITYINAYGTLTDPNTVLAVDKDGKETKITAKSIVIATGGRPSFPSDLPGVEYCISSDELFSLPHRPSSALVIGASYIALESAGLLNGLGCKTTVMVRSVLLRGFDRQMAQLIGDSLEEEGVEFIRESVPQKIVKNSSTGLLDVTYVGAKGIVSTKSYDTIMCAIGRTYVDNGLSQIGVKLSESGKVITDYCEMSSVKCVFAIGDINEGKPELTPVAIKAGKMLARRLFGKAFGPMDYTNIPTTVFAPIEYGTIGLSEEAAIEKYGADQVNVYHTGFNPLEWSLPHKAGAYCKLICTANDNDRVIGFHLFSPNAGEVTQGFALAMRLKATKADFDNVVGIHPTIAEEFTTLTFTKKEKATVVKSGC
jgi:thioredoxin reductase (NADPH)